jgi:hypothetical protein
MRSASGGAADLSSDKPFDDGPSRRAAILQSAKKSLVESVDFMRRKLKLTYNTPEIVKCIKKTMNAPLPPNNSSVIQTLCDRHYADAFNDSAAESFPGDREEFDVAIKEFATARGISGRDGQRLVNKAWKWDRAADRRAREGSAAPYKGRPEAYDRDVVWAFADAITRAAGRERLATGHHGDEAITEKDNKGGPMLRVLVASIRWAMIMAWLGAASPGTAPPTVKPEGILTVLKRGRPTNRQLKTPCP